MRATTAVVLTSPAWPHVALVPYTRALVPAYHAWMQDEGLRAATASERLTLEAELAMCAAWAADDGTATFIVIVADSGADASTRGRRRWTPVGDANLFLNDVDDRTAAEVGVMVAAATARRSGVASASVSLMLACAVSTIGLTRAVAKIGRDNAASLALFDRLGFTPCGGSDVFREEYKQWRADSERGRELVASVGEWRAVAVAKFAERNEWE